MVPESYRLEYAPADEDAVRKLAAETGYDEKFAALLAARGIRSRREAERFLNADTDMLYDPFLMKGMRMAVNRIMKALAKHEKITIYGDYDVDGITATSILYLFLKDLHADVSYYLPDRLSEGYGVNENAIRLIAEGGTGLVITVDTGITAVKECALASELGMDMIITDHHECQESIPDAVTVIDAKQSGETYPCKVLAGCGVSFKLACAIASEIDYSGDVFRFLELAAVGTVADIVPLVDENRIIVREGFKRMKRPSNLGLYKLLESAGYDFKRKLTSGYIGFVVAPRLNAGGRMGDAGRGVRLFTTKDPEEAAAIAAELNSENLLRKETEDVILHQVLEKIEDSPEIRKSRIMVVAGEEWHHGVIGIVSSRIKDRYYRPNILLTIEDGVASGSARSIDGFNLFEALCACSDLMIKFGGHEAAAGMSLKAENLPEFTRRLNLYAEQHMDERILIPVLRPEMSITPSQLTTDLIRMIEKMEPFGQSMPEPVIEIEGALSEVRAIGADGQTLRMKLSDRKGALTAIGFRQSLLCDYYSGGMIVSAAGNAGINVYNGREYPQLMIKAVTKKTTPALVRLCELFSLRNVTEDFRNYCMEQPKISRNACNTVYRYLLAIGRKQGHAGEGFLIMDDIGTGEGKTALDRIYCMMMTLCVFEELGLMTAESSGLYLHYQMIPDKKAKLSESRWFEHFFTV